MNSREIFIETMNFSKSIRSIKWEFGYWGKTIKNWYNQGLPKKNYPKIPTNISAMQTSIYTAAWTYKWKGSTKNNVKGTNNNVRIELPNGIPVLGGGLYWPSQGFALDEDVSTYFNFDKTQILVNIDQMFYPHFKVQIINEDKNSLTYVDLDGVKRKYLKKEATIPTALDWPIKDWESWNKIKE